MSVPRNWPLSQGRDNILFGEPEILKDWVLVNQPQFAFVRPDNAVVVVISPERRGCPIYTTAKFSNRGRRLNVARLPHPLHFTQQVLRVLQILNGGTAVDEVETLVTVWKWLVVKVRDNQLILGDVWQGTQLIDKMRRAMKREPARPNIKNARPFWNQVRYLLNDWVLRLPEFFIKIR